MFWDIDTIGKRLFLAFSILTLNTVVISALCYYYINKNKEIYYQSKQIELQHIRIERLLKLDLQFLRFETMNQEFYQTGKSNVLASRDSLYNLILDKNAEVHARMAAQSFDPGQQFRLIEATLGRYNEVFHEVKESIIRRGFKDYGLEGSMREYAHKIERQTPASHMIHILTMRRHEKDYLLRREDQYKIKLNSLADQLIESFNNRHDSLPLLVAAYIETFNRLALLDESIGLHPNQGMLGKLNNLTNDLTRQLEEFITVSDARADNTIRQSIIACIAIGLTTIIASLILTYVTSSRLARPIKKLSNTIGKYMVSQGLNEDELDDSAVTNEIRSLSSSFIRLTRKLKNQFEEIQRKSELLEKKNYDLQRLNEELDRFIYSSAHDLKSPLASMEGLIALARREINLAEYDHYFDKMKKSIEKMEGFIRDITDYAKNKRQQLKAERIRFSVILEDILQSLQFIPNAEKILTRVNIQDGEFYTDRTRLEIILKNLLSNAIRYSDIKKNDSFVSVVVTLHPEKAVLVIEDNGIGIDKDHIHKIFDMFYRAVDHAKGSGIGLFLVRESVKMLRGTISVQSQLGKGTVFKLELPNLKLINVNHLPETQPVLFLNAF